MGVGWTDDPHPHPGGWGERDIQPPNLMGILETRPHPFPNFPDTNFEINFSFGAFSGELFPGKLPWCGELAIVIRKFCAIFFLFQPHSA